MGKEKKGEGKRAVLLTVGFLCLTLQALAIVQEQGPGLKTQSFCSSLKVLYLYNLPPKATVSLRKEGRKKKIRL